LYSIGIDWAQFFAANGRPIHLIAPASRQCGDDGDGLSSAFRNEKNIIESNRNGRIRAIFTE